ncbi:hypothetical protein Bca52824_053938 [Brassica carinata]|uniref:Uncharacterized protein n=1 Tax=Brassica carinata TaxID=52824 RepID=A0A8X7R7K0_BRACI|nr:hypothetical protein Bca52824_053938 [Brassica carinata]
MPPPPARKEIVLALRAPSVVPVAQPKCRKRKLTKGGDGESSQQGDSSIASGLRGKCSKKMKTRLENSLEKEEPPTERHEVNKSELGATVGVGTFYNDGLGIPSSTFEIDVSRVRVRLGE